MTKQEILFAKEVRDFELYGATFDRTTRYAGAKRKKYDLDFRVLDAPNPTARDWNYASSRQTLKAIRNDLAKMMRKYSSYQLELRIVISATGEVVEIQDRKGKVLYQNEHLVK